MSTLALRYETARSAFEQRRVEDAVGADGDELAHPVGEDEGLRLGVVGHGVEGGNAHTSSLGPCRELMLTLRRGG